MIRLDEQKKQLGMCFGTARARLSRIIIFSLAKKLGLDVCFRCKQKILESKDLTIEHKKPWFRVSTNLFWDLDNIAFSHHACNSQEGGLRSPRNHDLVSPHKKTENAPAGFAWCSGHRSYVLIEKFHLNKRNVNKVASYCKECRKVRSD